MPALSAVAIEALNRARQEGALHMIIYYIKRGFVVTFIYLYLLLVGSSDDSSYILKAKRGGWSSIMINVITKVAYTAGDIKILHIAEWATAPPKQGKSSYKYARIKGKEISSERMNYYVIFCSVLGYNTIVCSTTLQEGGAIRY